MGRTNILTEKKAAALKDRLDQALGEHKKNCLALAELLHDTYISTIVVGEQTKFVYETWGYKTWAQFVRTEVGMFKATAVNYRKVWRVFGIELQGTFAIEDVLPIGKMVLLTHAELTAKNVNSWLKKARTMSCLDLKKEIGGGPRIRNFSVAMSEADLRRINSAIRVYWDTVDDTVTRAKVVASIMEDWKSKQRKLKKAS